VGFDLAQMQSKAQFAGFTGLKRVRLQLRNGAATGGFGWLDFENRIPGVLELERVAPVGRGKPFGRDTRRRREPAVDIQVAVQLAVAEVRDERVGAAGAVTSDDEVDRAGTVLDGAHQIEVVFRRIELGQVGKYLDEAEGQDDGFVGLLGGDHVEGDVAGRSDAAHADGAGVEAPVLGPGGAGRAQGEDQDEHGHEETNRASAGVPHGDVLLC
jgi:hypothetical protein